LVGVKLFSCVFPVDVAKKFGLTPEQFGENLRDNYQKHDVEQHPEEPLDMAQEYFKGYVKISCCNYINFQSNN